MHNNYTQVEPNFYAFPLPFMIVGIEFVSTNDATIFDMLIDKYCPRFDPDSELFEALKDKIKTDTEPLISKPVSFSKKETAWFNPVT